MDGYIKLKRDFKNWGWYGNITVRGLFLDLLLGANFKDATVNGIPLHRGEIATCIKNLARDNDLSVQSTRTIINKLIKSNDIKVKATNRYSVITICNYDSYVVMGDNINKQLTSNQQILSEQSTNNQLSANNQQTINQQAYNKNKDKKDKKEKNGQECQEESPLKSPQGDTTAPARTHMPAHTDAHTQAPARVNGGDTEDGREKRKRGTAIDGKNRDQYEHDFLLAHNVEEGSNLWKAIMDWFQYRKDSKKTYRSTLSYERFLKDLKKFSDGKTEKAIEVIDQSIANGWQGLFPLKQENEGTKGQGKEYEGLQYGERIVEENGLKYRTYLNTGVKIPLDAPHRPSEQYMWSAEDNCWILG